MGGLMGEELKDMTPKLIGETYLKKPTETSRQRYRYGLYECQYCGKEFETMVQNVKCGDTKSCGCNTREAQITHGLHQNKFYNRWVAMLDRCANLKNHTYIHYGGRGITVCKEWLDVRNFVAWCDQTYIEGMTLDRIDNDKGYSPENCRWVDKTTQCTNQRIQKNNTSGFVGVYRNNKNNKWRTFIDLNKIRFNIGTFKTKEEAVLARDNYIIENNLPHKLSTYYNKEIK